MAVYKAVNPAPETELIVVEETQSPDVEVMVDDEGNVEVSLDASMDDVGFYDNIAEMVTEQDRARIALDMMSFFEADKASRGEWENQYSKGLTLLGFRMEERTQPFRGASGAVHPMLTEAIIQFQAQAFKELMPAEGPVRTKIMGKETLDKAQQAGRVQDFMNYQITTVMEEFTPEMDQALFYLGYGGSVFKKVYYDTQLGRMVSKLVLPDDFFIPYSGSSVIGQCSRMTHRIAMYENDYRKRVFAGEYLDYKALPDDNNLPPSDIQAQLDRIVGISPTTENEDIFLLEFHVYLDLPGFEDVDEDGNPTGIKLPYVVTLEENSAKLIGIRRNWTEDDPLKLRKEFFVHYVLVEGPGAYGLGFVHLIGGLSKAATSALRQLLDAGTLSNLPAGFKAKGARIADDDNPIQPGEWRDIDAGGAELSSSLMPLPYKEPSQTLFALLGFTVDAGRRLAGISDMQVGDANQQAAVGTTIALLERGALAMSAIHKRLHYAQSQEFRMLAAGFGAFLPDEYPYDVPGASRYIKKQDFNNLVAVLPVADPNIFSTAQRIQLAQAQLQLAQQAPNMHNLYEAYYRVYAALNVRDIDGILRPQNTQMPKDPAQENADVMDSMELKVFAGQQHDAHFLSHLMMGLSPMLQALPQAAIELQKHILEHVRVKAEEDTAAELFLQYGTDPDRMVSDLQREALVAIKATQYMQQVRDMQNGLTGQNNQPDPVVLLKEKEIAIRAQAEQNRAAEAKAKLSLDTQKAQQNMQMAQARLASQERIAGQRASTARERIVAADFMQRRRDNAPQKRQ
jgi:hypothetical protein